MLDNNIAHALSCTLGDEDDADVGTRKETTELGLKILIRRFSIDDEEVLLATVALAHASQEETCHSGLVTDYRNQEGTLCLLCLGHFNLIFKVYLLK